MMHETMKAANDEDEANKLAAVETLTRSLQMLARFSHTLEYPPPP
jgi:hypothetical protein